MILDEGRTQGPNGGYSVPCGGAGRCLHWFAIDRERADADSGQVASGVRQHASRKGGYPFTLTALRWTRRETPGLRMDSAEKRARCVRGPKVSSEFHLRALAASNTSMKDESVSSPNRCWRLVCLLALVSGWPLAVLLRLVDWHPACVADWGWPRQ